jgi:hypothetical protein
MPTGKTMKAIFREWTALKSSLPLNLSSSIFVAVDETKVSFCCLFCLFFIIFQMNLLTAMITGPEGTPYANGCFVFDVRFPYVLLLLQNYYIYLNENI